MSPISAQITDGLNHYEFFCEQGAELRLDTFFREQFPSFSRSAAKEHISRHGVTVNNSTCKDPARILAAGDQVRCQLPDLSILPIPNPQLPLIIWYEDESLLIAEKPSGLHTVAHSPLERDTLANALTAFDPALSHGGRPLEAGIMHRLDQETSGMVLVGRTDQARSRLTAMMRTLPPEGVSKGYEALVYGCPPPKGELVGGLRPKPGDRRRQEVDTKRANRLCSRFEVLQTYGNAFALLRLELLGGARHQLRVHLAAAGYPIVGDRLYDEGLTPADSNLRLMLHARRLRFKHPAHGDGTTARWVDVTGELPTDFLSLVEQLTGRPLRSPGSQR